MVPAAVIALDAFPLLPNGKVDVAALPEPDWEAAGAEEYEAPADEVEATVAAAFGTVLGRAAPVSATADFFEAGGDSLQAMRCSALIQEALGIHVPAHEIIAAPAARRLAVRVKELLIAAGGAPLDDGLRREDWAGSALRPASAGQESLYLQSTVINPGGVEVSAR
jgi:acyl carrier protein